MGVPQWFVLAVTILLLVCEVTISQLCNSLIVLVDSFHTLFILIHMALTPQTASGAPPLSSPDPPTLPPQPPPSSAASLGNRPAESSTNYLPGTASEPPVPNEASPPDLGCGLSYTSCRIPVVGGFLSALVLASLCLSGIIEIINLLLGPKPVQRHLLLVVVSSSSLLHKMLVLWLNWDRQRTPDTKSTIKVHHTVSAEGEAKGQTDPGKVLHNFGQVRPAVDDSIHNGALVLCNPGASSIMDADPQDTKSRAKVFQEAKAPEDSIDGVHTASNSSPFFNSLHLPDELAPSNQRPEYLLSFALILQTLGSALLALTHSLVMLMIGPKCTHSSGACEFLVFQDPSLSLLAVIMLIVMAMLQVRRYGLLLLQAAPPYICVSDLGQRIESIPGVQAVHDLHIWQLSESIMVASVHVHCHADFPAHRCADLMSGVTKVLQSVGVNCCTVQPEFISCSGSSSCEASAVAHIEDSSLPCLLACKKACAEFMCCSSLREETQTLPPPSAKESTEEPQPLILRNALMMENE